MQRIRRSFISIFSMLAVAVAMIPAVPAHRAVADDETHDTEIKVQAVLDAVSCDAVPPTITVLGMTIDVSTARIEGPGSTAPDSTPSATPEPGDDGNHSHGGGSNDPLPGGCYYCPRPSTPVPTPAVPNAVPAATGCAALVAGQPVEVTLASDRTPLVATEVKQDGQGNAQIKDTPIRIEAPIREIDATAETITVLGLTIDVASAELNGADDESSDGNSQPIDFSRLMMGQFVEVKLASSAAPLTATELELKNFTNQVQVEIEDASGNAVQDVDDDGNPVDDIQVDIIETIMVQNPAAPAGTPRVKKVLQLHTTSNGIRRLGGLASGHAKIQVTRVNHGVISRGRRRFPVRGNTARFVHVRLH